MSSSKRIEDIDEDIVNYNADSDDDKISNDSEPEDQFRRRPAPDLGKADGYDSAGFHPKRGRDNPGDRQSCILCRWTWSSRRFPLIWKSLSCSKSCFLK